MNNVSYTMENNNINGQINNTYLSGNSNLQEEINNDSFVPYESEIYECSKELNNIRAQVIDYEFDRIEDCITICNEANIQDAEIENNFHMCKSIFDHNFMYLYRNACTKSSDLRYISKLIEKVIQSLFNLLKKTI